MTKKRIKVIHFQRRSEAGVFSIERVFADIRSALPDDIDVDVRESRFLSWGVWRRAFNVVEAAVRQGEVNHVTGDVHFLTCLLDRRRTVLTVHDCVSLERLQGFRRWLFWLFWYWLPLRRCRAVTVISASTKRELMRFVKCDPDLLRVIHDCIPDWFRPDAREFNAASPRILQIGTTQNKNIERVAAALADISCRLVIMGRLSDSQREALVAHKIDYENLMGLSEEALLDQYRLADMVVFASTYEGFGLPIVEANAVGRPVVSGDLYSMPEVAGDAACLVDPYDVASIHDGILSVIQDADYRRRLVEAGFRNVERFRPAAIAAQYAALYREIVGRASD